ncbi:helix-turn-helix domain-containing protein [Labrys sp. KB_33_2]|uniref:helix-turn-helix domain-containing protein n=1 Tax=Labrys sp. KB_33_2 TaxID=3237479 RepID=UPI003F90B7AB
MNVLQRYFLETGDTPSKLALRIGRSPSTISRVLRGERSASTDLAIDIEAGTNGKVSARDCLAIQLDMLRGHSGSSALPVVDAQEAPATEASASASVAFSVSERAA